MFNNCTPIFEFRGPWGVPIQLAGSIIFLPLIFVDISGGPVTLVYDLIFLALLVGSILLHELGHAWGCLIQAVPVNRIMLHGGGGFCERRRSATRYEQELIVAMGPIVNLALWAVASLIAPLMINPDLAWGFETLALINLFLAVFNLLPVQPLDGGKLFHLALARMVSPEAATRISGGVGLFIALLWVPMMILSYMTIGLVLLFFPPIALHWQMVRRAV